MTDYDANQQWLLKSRPQGMVTQDNFELVNGPLPEPDYAAGQVLLKTLMLSFDPAMRGWMTDEPSYLPPVALGEPMRASAVAQVVESENADLPVGTLVQGLMGWQSFSIGDPDSALPPNPLPEGTPPNLALSVFGGTSLTAYFGLLDIGQPKAGETVLVSGAAGATGSAAAQIARLRGCRVVGIAGGPEKCAWLRESCKLDAVIDYKNEDLSQSIAKHCPQGVDVFFDNVGGATLEAAIEHMAEFGRIALCGAIASYNDVEPAPGPRNLMNLVTRRVKMQGFIMLDYIERVDEAMTEIVPWVMEGQFVWREDLQTGFENIPSTFLRLFDGRNEGKQLLQLAEPD
ncbi:MAG: NADP-dependent oxidoreductase [Halioglobus sp.]